MTQPIPYFNQGALKFWTQTTLLRQLYEDIPHCQHLFGAPTENFILDIVDVSVRESRLRDVTFDDGVCEVFAEPSSAHLEQALATS